MSENIILAILIALPATIASLAVLIKTIRNSSKIDDIKDSFNGRTDALIRLREEQAFQRGFSKGQEHT